MMVAFATTDEQTVNEHFGRSGQFVIYEITAAGRRLVEVRRFSEGPDRAVIDTREQGRVHDDAVQAKVERLADCKLVYVTEIGGPSAARLVTKGIMPMKVKEPVSIELALNDLDDMMRKTPPPWLRKEMKR